MQHPNLTARTLKIIEITNQSRLMHLFIFLSSPEHWRISARITHRNNDHPPSAPQIENPTPNKGKLQHIPRNHASAVRIIELSHPLTSTCPAESRSNSKQRKAPSKPTNEEEEPSPRITTVYQQKTPNQEATRRGASTWIPNPMPPPTSQTRRRSRSKRRRSGERAGGTYSAEAAPPPPCGHCRERTYRRRRPPRQGSRRRRQRSPHRYSIWLHHIHAVVARRSRSSPGR